MGIFDKLKQALFKTGSILPGSKKTEEKAAVQTEEKVIIDDFFFDDLFEKLIKADVGLELSEKIIDHLKSDMKVKETTNLEIKSQLKEAIKNTIGQKDSEAIGTSSSPEIILIVGINGSGKTTSIGKLANKFKQSNKKVLIAAGDTFRAAAGEQLEIWAKRADVEIFSPQEIKKPDAVVYSSIEKAKKENFDILLIDTAGRLQSQTNLMDELKKIDSVVNKISEGIKVEKLIVLDATIGQNAINQAEMFSKVIGLTGIILSKLDSSSKGGVVLNIMHKLSLPVKIIGTGEKIDDIIDFNFDEYVEGLLD